MKNLTIIIFLFAQSAIAFSQSNRSIVDSSTKKTLLESLMKNQDKADIPHMVEKLTDNVKAIRILPAAVVVQNKEKAPADLDLIKNLWIGDLNQGGYIFYNDEKNGKYDIVGSYYYDSSTGAQLYPPTSAKERSLLNDVSRYYNIMDVTFLKIEGIAGTAIMHNNEIWIIDGNTRTDLATYVKEYYPNLDAFRGEFLQEIQSK